MAYQPFDRNPSGIVFFGTSASDQLYESNSNFTYDGSTLNLPNITIANGGNIGSVSDTDAISISAGGDVSFSQDISVAGNLTVNGTTTTVNSTVVTIEDPIIVLGSGSPSADDNKDRGIQFNWYSGSAKTGFFGFDDSTGKFTFVPDATIAGEVVSGSAGTIVANLEGNADTATTAVDASGLTGTVTIQLSNQLSGSATFQDAGDTATISATLDAASITGQAVTTSSEDADLVLIYDDSASALRKITRGNFVADLGIMDNFLVAGDAGSSQTISDGNTLTIAGGSGLLTTASATDTLTIDVKTTNGIEISSDAVGLASSVAGNGLAYSAGVLSVGVDGSTIEINTDQLRVKDAGITFAKLNGGAYLTSAEAFSDSDTQLMTAAAIADKIESYSYLVSGDLTAGNLIDISGTTINVDLTEATEATIANGDYLVFLDGGATGTQSKGTVAGLATLLGGDGLGVSGSTLSVNVDDSTIEVNTDTLRVKGLGIGNAQLAADAVDGTKIADDSVDSEHIAAGAIDNEHYSTGSITENKLDRTIETASSSKTADKDITLVDATSGSVTITLPENGGTGWSGDTGRARIMVVKRIDSSANNVIVSRETADTIDGATSVQLYHRYETMTFASDGANWHII
jgi:hypothetical protein